MKDGAEYNFGDAVNSDITLVATWTKSKYLVSFNFNEGTLNGDEILELEVEWKDTVANPGTPQRDESSGFTYEFAGYTTSKNGDVLFDFDTEITENTIVYAKWTEVPKSVDQTELLANLNGIIANFDNYPYDEINDEELLLKVMEVKDNLVRAFESAVNAINNGETVTEEYLRENCIDEYNAVKTIYNSIPDEGANSKRTEFDNIFFEIGDSYLTYLADYFGVFF